MVFLRNIVLILVNWDVLVIIGFKVVFFGYEYYLGKEEYLLVIG